MSSVAAKPVCAIPLDKRKAKGKAVLCKKRVELKQMRNILGPMSRIKIGHLRYHQCQPVNAKIYPKKFPANVNVEGRETEDSSSESTIRHIDPFEAYPFQSDVNDDANIPMEAYDYVDDICAFYKSKEKSMCIKPNLIARLKHGFMFCGVVD
ncbi:uncharacterized protein LOC104442493 [Eucalyptus grandis]|uniref:uncharacterized protein LOC104442493 n=1 Tax=Eucalyptus grandis TaxID=71139 RepID=UPI00192EBB94|nr:uncharacterized protein LOC104442493 [Eucalyptus grandis]